MAEGLTFEQTKREYLKIFFMLVAFTLLTVLASLDWMPKSWGHFGHTLHIAVGLIIAFLKAGMVVWIFMHIKFDNPYLRAMIFIPLFLFAVLLFSLTLMGL